MINFQRKKGFTVFEIMVAASIGVLLTTIVLISLTNAKQQSRDGKRVSDIKHLQLALEQFYDACGQYPPTITNLNYNGGCAGSTKFGSFLSEVLRDPINDATYYYRYYAEASASAASECYIYHIGAQLENTGHRVLVEQDAEISDSTTISSGIACTGTTASFNGTDPVYDNVPSR